MTASLRSYLLVMMANFALMHHAIFNMFIHCPPPLPSLDMFCLTLAGCHTAYCLVGLLAWPRGGAGQLHDET